MTPALKHIPTRKNTKALKALIVDDLKINRSLARIMLERRNFEILEAENGVQALDQFKGENPDVILMDICMPVMGGVEAMKQIRMLNQDLSNIPIIAFTSGEHKESKSDLMDEGFSEYIKKPCKEKELLQKISLFLPMQKTG